jgi:hypothetical protein
MLEDLPNELILEIFSFLELTDLHRSFSSLNSRFECLLYNNFTYLYARLTPNIFLPLEKYYSRINHLSLIEWNPNDILLLLDPTNNSQLTYLNIESTNNLYFGEPINNLIHRILSLPNLCKFQIKVSPTLYILDIHLPFSSSIQHLNLSMITLDMLFNLLIHVPNLRSLNVWLNSNGRIFDSQTYNRNYYCLNLKKLIIGLHNDIKFEEILFLLPRMPILHSFQMFGSVWDQEYLNERHWENILLGQNLFPLLNKINIKILIRSRYVPDADSISSRFKKNIFRRTNFSVRFDRMLWFYLNCLWKN